MVPALHYFRQYDKTKQLYSKTGVTRPDPFTISIPATSDVPIYYEVYEEAREGDNDGPAIQIVRSDYSLSLMVRNHFFMPRTENISLRTVSGSCTCGKWTSNIGTEAQVAQDWYQHLQDIDFHRFGETIGSGSD